MRATEGSCPAPGRVVMASTHSMAAAPAVDEPPFTLPFRSTRIPQLRTMILTTQRTNADVTVSKHSGQSLQHGRWQPLRQRDANTKDHAEEETGTEDRVRQIHC